MHTKDYISTTRFSVWLDWAKLSETSQKSEKKNILQDRTVFFCFCFFFSVLGVVYLYIMGFKTFKTLQLHHIINHHIQTSSDQTFPSKSRGGDKEKLTCKISIFSSVLTNKINPANINWQIMLSGTENGDYFVAVDISVDVLIFSNQKCHRHDTLSFC